jgi:outer membrane protein OmpA-like peptidoglycan-associated protein
MRIPPVVLPLLLVLGSCSSPPKPPTADEAKRRPANAAVAISLQACEGELHNTRIAQRDSARAAESANAALVRLASQQQALAAHALRLEDKGNTVYTVLFAFGDSRVALSTSDAERLIEAARGAALVALRGRTDGSAESAAESRIARERSEAVRDLLIRGGVDPSRIRSTWQPVGDHAADNTREGGRRLNRRVEIELYPAAPRLASLEPRPEP